MGVFIDTFPLKRHLKSRNPDLNVSSTDVGTTTMTEQRLVAVEGEEDHQPHPKSMEHPTSPMDDGKPTEPDIPTVFIKSRHDDGPTSSKPLPEFNPDALIERTFLVPPKDNGERLSTKVTRKGVKVIKKADDEESKNSATFLALIMARLRWQNSSPIAN